MAGRAAVELETNEQGRPRVWLRCGPEKVYSALSFSGPDYVGERHRLEFGNLSRRDPPQTRTITIRRGDGGPVKPEVTAVAPPRGFSAGGRGPFNVSAVLREVEHGKQYELDVTIRPPWPNASLVGEVVLATGVPEQPTDRIFFLASLPSRVQWKLDRTPMLATPSEVCEVTASFVWSDDAPSGRITGVTTAVEGLGATVEERGGEQVVVIRIQPDCPKLPEGEWHRVIVHTDDPWASEIELPVNIRAPHSRPPAR